MMKFSESIGEMSRRVEKSGPRKPLRSLAEMADEFSISSQQLAKLLLKNDGPKPEISASRAARGRRLSAWYEPKKMREWYGGLTEKPAP